MKTLTVEKNTEELEPEAEEFPSVHHRDQRQMRKGGGCLGRHFQELQRKRREIVKVILVDRRKIAVSGLKCATEE